MTTRGREQFRRRIRSEIEDAKLANVRPKFELARPSNRITRRCPSRKTVAVDYRYYYPAQGGHAIRADELYDTFEVDEERAGATYGDALCDQCQQRILVVLENDREEGGDTCFLPSDPDQWRRPNRL